MPFENFDPILPYLSWRETKLFGLVTGTAKKQRLSGNMLPKFEHMRKWMVKFLIRSESRGIKISRVNSIRITKSIYLL